MKKHGPLIDKNYETDGKMIDFQYYCYFLVVVLVLLLPLLLVV